MQYYSYFAYLLLNGDIYPQFKTIKKLFSARINIDDVLDDTNVLARVTRLLSNLAKFKIEDKESL